MRLSIILDLFSAITFSPISRDDINMNAAFKLVFIEFFRMREFTHTKQRAVDSQTFVFINFIRSDVRLVVDHATVRLKRNKTDRDHLEVTIVVVVTEEHNCSVLALQQFFEKDSQSGDVSLFSLVSGGFSRDKVLATLKQCL